jgi:hypothetical protein
MTNFVGKLYFDTPNATSANSLSSADLYGSVPNLTRPYLRLESTILPQCIVGNTDAAKQTIAPGFQALCGHRGFAPAFLDILHKVHTMTEDLNVIKKPKSETVPISVRRRLRSIQYYCLLEESNETTRRGHDQVARACHVGMLIYAGIIQNDFRVATMSRGLVWRLKCGLQTQTFATSALSGLRLWLLFLIGSLDLDASFKVWVVTSIVEVVAQLLLFSWSDTKSLLEKFAWVQAIQDQAGRSLWDEAMRMRNTCSEMDFEPYFCHNDPQF